MLAQLYTRIIPKKLPKVGDEHHVPTGPATAVMAVVTAVDPEGVMILKLPSGVRLAGYSAKIGGVPGVSRVRQDGSSTPEGLPEEVWIFKPIEA